MTIATSRRSFLQFVLTFLPFVSLVFLVFIASIPIGVSFWPEMSPMLVLVAVFFWSSDLHHFLPFWSVFVVGLLLDVLTGMPLGLYALTLLVVAGLTSTQRRALAGKPFYIIWFGLTVISFGALAVNYLVNVLYYLRLFEPVPVLVQWLVCVVVYPCMALLLGQVRFRISKAMRRQG